MGKQESSFYVIHKPDDAFDRAWASAAATPTPPKPDEGLWTDRKHAATYEGNGWVNVVVNPDPNKLPGSRAGQLFAFEITANESLAPMRFTTRLRGEVVTSMPASTSREGNLSGEKGEAPKDEQHRHQLLLDSPVIEMTYLGKRARTLDDPVSNPFRQTYLLPKRALCSCGSTLLLPSSCADGRVQIRYWFEIVGQRLNSSESRLRWKGKNRLPDMDERHSAKVLAIPVRITAERYSPQYIPSPDDLAMAGTSRNEPPVSVSQRGDETLTTRYFLEDERPKLAGFDVSSLKLVYRITTPNEGPASLHVRLEVSLGIYQDGPRYRELCDSFAKTHLSVTFHLVRQTMIVPPAPTPAPEPEDRKGKGKAKAKSTSLPHGVAVSPFVESDTFGAPLQIDKPYISTDLRLVGPPGVKERAQELFLKFDGDLVLACGVTVDAKTRESELQSALPSRVQACNAEVRYDLVADLTDPSAPSTSSIRAQDVRIDLPASLLTGLQQQSRPSVPTQTSETFPTRMLSIAREAGLVNPSQYEWMSGLSSETLASLLPATASARAGPSRRYRAAVESEGAQLPAYEPSTLSSSASPAAADHRDEKRRAGTAATDGTGESEPVPPPAYPASRESTAGHAGETLASSSARTDPGGRFSRMLSSVGRASAARAETATARRPLVVSAPMSLPPTSTALAPAPEQEAPPPSWEDTVRDDVIEDWVAASLAIGTDDPAPSPPSKVERSCM